MLKNFDETVHLQSEKRVDTRERLLWITEDASSATHLASSSATSFPGRNEGPIVA